MLFRSNYTTQLEVNLHKRFGSQKEDEEGRELQGEFFELSLEDKQMFQEHCRKAENMFLILESNTYLQDKGKR